jgi:hypothetical protein
MILPTWLAKHSYRHLDTHSSKTTRGSSGGIRRDAPPIPGPVAFTAVCMPVCTRPRAVYGKGTFIDWSWLMEQLHSNIIQMLQTVLVRSRNYMPYKTACNARCGINYCRKRTDMQIRIQIFDFLQERNEIDSCIWRSRVRHFFWRHSCVSKHSVRGHSLKLTVYCTSSTKKSPHKGAPRAPSPLVVLTYEQEKYEQSKFPHGGLQSSPEDLQPLGVTRQLKYSEYAH